MDFATEVGAGALQANICSKLAFLPQRGPVDPQFQVERSSWPGILSFHFPR